MRLDRGSPSSKKLGCGSTPKSTELDDDEQEMPSVELAKRGSPSSEERLTPMGMRIVVSLPEMTSPGDSSAEEVGLLPFVYSSGAYLKKLTQDAEDSDRGNSSLEVKRVNDKVRSFFFVFLMSH